MNKTFKDFITEDLDVFFNVDEMADKHELEGQELDLIVVDSSLEDLKGFGRDQLNVAQEVFKIFKTVYVKSSDFYIPKVDSELVLDGESYYVEEAKDQNGVIKIVLSANES
ncbi:hypothetical protein J2D69_15895 [Lysinibacillus sphaericus]|uniref:Uncharacterized protein n=3 Tax=Lysinibacillus TaxID=400634 RepID=W7RKM1_LYSSH|nr:MULTISPECIES: hypothetical protein [Lysinibacillus]MBE5082970.1 hypothetical protein [Bacillus thuringiensis]ACA41240.1 conserved hypothetical protein [Lysinibacillus sphaericus C3-41]AMO32846.1 hypothetical protein AR327_10555 [Lysinibacillus sphaericus]AMR92050.1 hypothetical protein A1T07_18650 [Lysinibacillus sphaericus]ANA46098.1 hypothetical protein A2J09_11320 [Lysinibacillus sphaericus]